MRKRVRHLNPKGAGAVISYDSRSLSDSDGTAIQTWIDRCGSYNATQATPTRRPVVKSGSNGINGQTVLLFDGTDDTLRASNVPLNTYITFIVCGKFNSTSFQNTNAPGFFEHGADAADGFYYFTAGGLNNGCWKFKRAGTEHFDLGTANFFGTDPAIGSLKYNGSGLHRKNGIVQNTGTPGGSPLSNVQVTLNMNICSRNGSSIFTGGLLGCLSIFDGAMADSLLKRFEQSAAFSFKIACS